jgi:ADP-ribose pyrophosphatase
MKYTAFKTDDVEIVRQDQAYDGYFRIDKYRLRHRLYEGGWGPEIEREVFERGHAVAVLPYDPKLDRVILIEQFRTGALAAQSSQWYDDHESPWIIEGVAGIIDPGESPETVARREVEEEIGRTVSDLRFVSRYLVSPGGTSETVFLYIGRVDARDVEGVFGLAHEGEDILPFTLSRDEALAWVEEGKIANATTIIGLQWLQLNHAKLSAEWA